MSIAELLIRSHVLGVRNLAVERHDWTERVTLGNQTQLARRKVMVVTLDIHHRFFNRLQRLFLKIVDRHIHHHCPNRLTVVKNARVLFLLFSAIEEAAQQRDEDILKEPLEHAPEHEFVLVGEVAGILIFSAELKPGDPVYAKAVQNRDPGKHLKPIELHELVNLLVEYFFVFALHEPGRHNLRHEFRQKIRNISILCISLKKLLKDISALLSACLRIHEHLLLTLSPIIEQGTIFSQVIIVVESALLPNHVFEHLFALFAHRLAHSIESKDLLHDFVSDLRVCLIFGV